MSVSSLSRTQRGLGPMSPFANSRNDPRHSITSSARDSSVEGIKRSSALAVLRLTENSNFIGCSIGRSLAFVPLKILAM
jgi:hypothetical protein